MEYFIGVVVSLLVQWLKKNLKMGGFEVLVTVAFVSLLAAVLYTWLVSAGYWANLAHILMVAGSFYAFIVKTYEGLKEQ